MGHYWVYIITNTHKNVVYIGVTNNLERRIFEHKTAKIKGFASKYNLNRLVYNEVYSDVEQAIAREKQIKGYKRCKKDELINKNNPSWQDLSADWYNIF